MQGNYTRGGYGYGHAKNELHLKLLEHFSEARQTMKILDDNQDEVLKLMKKGADKARETARKKLQQAKTAMGLVYAE